MLPAPDELLWQEADGRRTFELRTQIVPRKLRTSLNANYALVSSTTFYTRHGDWLAYACAIISIVALVFSFTPGKGRS